MLASFHKCNTAANVILNQQLSLIVLGGELLPRCKRARLPIPRCCRRRGPRSHIYIIQNNVRACDPLALLCDTLTAWPPSDTMAYQNNTLCLRSGVCDVTIRWRSSCLPPPRTEFLYSIIIFSSVRRWRNRPTGCSCMQPASQPDQGVRYFIKRERGTQSELQHFSLAAGRKMHALDSLFSFCRNLLASMEFSSPVSERFIYMRFVLKELSFLLLAWILWLSDDMLMRPVESGWGVRAPYKPLCRRGARFCEKSSSLYSYIMQIFILAFGVWFLKKWFVCLEFKFEITLNN